MQASEELKTFLDFLKECKTQYQSAYEAVGVEDKRTQDYLHAIEFEPHVDERSRICTKLRHSRMERRVNKDIVEELEPIVEFIDNPANKKTLDLLTQVLGVVRKAEKYHKDRTYIPRVVNKDEQ